MVKADYGTIQEIKTPFQQSPSKSWVWAHNTDMVIVQRLHETENFLCIHVYVYVVEARSCRQTRHSTHLQRINITHNTLYSFCFLSGHKTMKTVTEKRFPPSFTEFHTEYQGLCQCKLSNFSHFPLHILNSQVKLKTNHSLMAITDSLKFSLSHCIK